MSPQSSGCWRLPQLTNEEAGYPDLTNQRPESHGQPWLLVITTSADTCHLGELSTQLISWCWSCLWHCYKVWFIVTYFVVTLTCLRRLLFSWWRCQSGQYWSYDPWAAGSGGVDRRKSRQNMVRTVIEMWRAIRGTETNNGKHNWRDSSFYYFQLLTALTTAVPVQRAFDDDERMSLVCIKLEKLVDKNPSF